MTANIHPGTICHTVYATEGDPISFGRSAEVSEAHLQDTSVTSTLKKETGFRFLRNVGTDKTAWYNIPEMYVRFEVLTAATMKNAVFWDIKTQFVPQPSRLMLCELSGFHGGV
jgi:hypothetical protein